MFKIGYKGLTLSQDMEAISLLKFVMTLPAHVFNSCLQILDWYNYVVYHTFYALNVLKVNASRIGHMTTQIPLLMQDL